MSVEIIDEVQDLEREDGDIQPKESIIWNYFKIDGVQSKKGGGKNVTCIFCEHVLIGCSSSRAFAHILGRPVLDQRKSNVCIPIRRDDDDRYAKFKNAQKDLNKEMMSKEAQLSSSKAKQSVLNLTSLGKRTVTGEMKIVESKTLDSTIASFIYENALSFNVADSPSFTAMVDQCIEFDLDQCHKDGS
jgi:hypothetical protein